MHRGCTGMVGTANKYKLHARLRRDGFHYAERPANRFENRSLLDVKFQVRKRVVAQYRSWNFRRVQSKVFDGGANGDSVHVLALQKFFVEPADERAAADERSAEAHSFLFGKTENLDRERKPAAI